MRRLLAGALLTCASASVAGAQEARCDTLVSEVTLSGLSGQKIDSVFIETAGPNLGRLGAIVRRLHVRPRDNVVRRELLFSAGDTVDTLAIAESLRRLRGLAFLSNARIEARQCLSIAGQTLALTVMTRDSWTT